MKINEIKYPESKIWYTLLRDGEIVGYGELEPNQVLSTTADIKSYENKEDWFDILTESRIQVEEIE